mgnify:CR=1 FL=1
MSVVLIPVALSPMKFANLRWGGSTNLLRMSAKRRPNMGVSTVRTRALKPAFSARSTSLLVTSLDETIGC